MIPIVDLESYRYELPKERIAHYPVSPRDQSKLLVCDGEGNISAHVFSNIVNHLPEGAIIVFNQTKVIRARLLFQTETGANIELFCLEPVDGVDQLQALSSVGTVDWMCLVGNAKRWKGGELTMLLKEGAKEIVLTARLKEKNDDGSIVNFQWTPDAMTWVDVLDAAGKMPLPPYIKREASNDDEESYQTVYAKVQGSVAAPTAGLHFTKRVLDELKTHQMTLLNTTLHVGAGTFKPIKADHIVDHEMHAEELLIEYDFISNLYAQQGMPIVAVGTTSVRCLESLYWMGVKVSSGAHSVDELNVLQWDPYNLSTSISYHEAIILLKKWMEERNFKAINVKTSIIIVPGYKFKAVDFLITNFHQPESTLMLLVAAFLGKSWSKVYQFGLENDFRFLSYGDSSLLTKNVDNH